MTRPLPLLAMLATTALLALPAAAQTAPTVAAAAKSAPAQDAARGAVTTSTQGMPLLFGALGGAKVAAGVIAPVLLLGAMSNSGSH